MAKRHKLAIGALLALACAQAGADDRWALCPAWPGPQFDPGPDTALAPDERPLRITADRLDSERAGESLFSGEVVLRHGPRTLTADRVQHDRDANVVTAHGAIQFSDESVEIGSGGARLELDADRLRFDGVEFRLLERRARGRAASLEAQRDRPIRITGVRYTACPPENEVWLLHAPDIELDTEAGVGTGRNVRLHFQGVPIFWSPWISFPLNDERKSGLLAPDFGNARNTGVDIRVPWYWNIGPNHDATITPRWMEKRGTQVLTEYRYLLPASLGQVDLEFLPRDRETDEWRGRAAWLHHGEPAPGWQYGVDFGHASDPDYFEDLAGGLDATVMTHQLRRAEVAYHGDNHTFVGRVDGWQTLDREIALEHRPYARLPQLIWQSRLPLLAPGVHARFDGELVAFDARHGRVTGSRADLQPSLWLPLGGPAWHLVPRAAWRHTEYKLDDTAPGTPGNPTRTLPVYSVDAGLAFERPLHRQRVQTLEPRALWLHVPFRDQDQLPLFDTSVPDFNLVQLYTGNRFNGADRVGDADQVALGLASRVLSTTTGDELLAVEFGRIRYFDDRRVTLPGEPVDTARWSDLLAAADASLSADWSARLGLQYDPGDDQVERGLVQLRWHPGGDRLVNMGWRYRRDRIDQTDLSFAWPITARWSAYGRWNWSLQDRRNIETFLGFEYQSCCWAVRIVTREYIANRAGDVNRSLYVQLELKGLTNVGRGAEALLERGILGYSSRR